MSERRIAIPYSFRPIYKATSRIRLEKPHSLSYHDSTLTKLLSITLVRAESKIDDEGLPLKSTDTSSSSQYCSTPFSGPSAAARTAALTAASVAGFSFLNDTATTE